MVVRVNVVVSRTVVDSDWRFDDPCGSHLPSQSDFISSFASEPLSSVKLRNKENVVEEFVAYESGFLSTPDNSFIKKKLCRS